MKLLLLMSSMFLFAPLHQETQYFLVTDRIVTPELGALKLTIARATAHFLSLYATPQNVDNGHCGAFALMVQKHAGGTVLHVRAVRSGRTVGGHTVLAIDTRLYDIEHPEGVTTFDKLNYFKRLETEKTQ